MARVARTSRILAAVAGVAISVFSLGACTSALAGSGTYNGAGPSTETTTESTPSDTSSSDSGSTDTGSGGSSKDEPSSDTGAANFDAGEGFKFNNGVEVKIDSIKKVTTYKGLIGDEEGRAILLTVDNKSSDATIDSSSYLQLSSVYCGDQYSEKPYILKSEKLSVVSPDEVKPGAKAQFEISLAIKPEVFGKCVVNFAFQADSESDPITAKFVATIK